MKKNTKGLELNPQAKKLLLEELFEDSVFNTRSYRALEDITLNQSNQDDNDNLDIPEEAYYGLTTSRNRNLITSDQQKILQKITVGFFGLSVGSHAALTWMMEARSDCVKIADPDVISPTNLNRLRVGWQEIGKLKIDVLKRQLMEINPLAEVITYAGKEVVKINELFESNPKMDIVIDSIDDMYGKIYLRKYAKERKIPLISAADVGDNITLDIERYDHLPQPQMFLGRIKNIEKKDYSKLNDFERRQAIIDLVGFEKNSEAMLESLYELGETLGTWPQLGATATMAGGIIATAIKKIVLGENINSGRYYICLDEILNPDFNSLERKKQREEVIKRLRTKWKLD